MGSPQILAKITHPILPLVDVRPCRVYWISALMLLLLLPPHADCSSIQDPIDISFIDKGSSVTMYQWPTVSATIRHTLSPPGLSGKSGNWYKLDIEIPAPIVALNADKTKVTDAVFLNLADFGSISLAVKDDQARFGGHSLHYRVITSWSAEAIVHGDTLHQHFPADSKNIDQFDVAVRETAIFLAGLTPAGPGLGLLSLAETFQADPTRVLDFQKTPLTPYGDANQPMGLFDDGDAGAAENSIFSDDGGWDYTSISWDRLNGDCSQDGGCSQGPGGYMVPSGSNITYFFELIGESSDSTELYIRMVIPYVRITAAGHRPRRHLEIERVVQLEGISEAAESTTDSTASSELFTRRIDGGGLVSAGGDAYVAVFAWQDMDDKAYGTILYDRAEQGAASALSVQSEAACLGVFSGGTEVVVAGPVRTVVKDSGSVVSKPNWIIIEIQDREKVGDRVRAMFKDESTALTACASGPSGSFPGVMKSGDFVIH